MKFSSREEGQGLVEYALLLVLVAVVVLGILSLLGPMVRSTFGKIVGVFGGAGQFQYAIQGSPSITSAPGDKINTCTLRVHNLNVSVNDLGEPVENLTVVVTVSWANGSGELSKKTTQNGTVSWSNEVITTASGSCGDHVGQSAAISVAGAGGASASTAIQ